MLLRIALFAAAFNAAFVLAQDAPTCISKPDHSNYGKNGDTWCQWSSVDFWEPQGVGCTTDAECQNVHYPYSNCHDPDSINADSLLATGVMYCDYITPDSPKPQCMIGVGLPPNHAGAQGSSGGVSSSGEKGQDVLKFCRDYLSKLGFTDINIVAGCRAPDPNPDNAGQCIYQCNGGSTCGKDADPKAYHRMDRTLPSCPGYESAN
ncbi:hypothetical protein CERZMDRAFT_103015 [Cercospora zeae-maydis SCOH1-5]|uniref:Uncharacterized protein n=1 Tax=Cercospora zeae-maydis SCOH1-5 TaxID=717836 RepID=A0A6A6EXA5_9PEZI|nr:hypothetical protein CERZMDRAFT_103015 [Cercospora zeae-maydis SCOH1-5]